MNYKSLSLFIYVLIFILWSSCQHINTDDLIQEPPDDPPFISNSSPNRFLGYKKYISDGDPKDEKWISRIFVYEKYIVYEIAWAYDVAGYVFYKNNPKIHFEKAEDQPELFEIYGYYFLGIYNDYLFLLSQGNSPMYRDFTIVDLKSDEKIYEGIYIFDIGIEIKDKIEICKYYGEKYLWGRDEYGFDAYKYVFHLYSFNLKTRKEKNLNKTIEVIKPEMEH